MKDFGTEVEHTFYRIDKCRKKNCYHVYDIEGNPMFIKEVQFIVKNMLQSAYSKGKNDGEKKFNTIKIRRGRISKEELKENFISHKE
jgi:hypothetical protein